ncbi:MAG TPA: cytochrome c oxidase subunit II [Gemmatimonadaceae bacterium]|nr:cytochrome c oxidase subunit II [Gemmatimonadaceae bacterium]
MIETHRPRRLAAAGVSVALALALAACAQEYPNTTFSPNTEFGRAIDELWNSLLFWGTVVFIVVSASLLFILVRFRRRPGAPEPRQVHGNTALEIAWTLIPAVILIFIAVPTVRTIFATQARAPEDALTIEVIGHQWWWEFRYPEYGITTANELYIPRGRAVNFELRTADVLHSFWIPQMGGKRDLISNRTNYLWFTPDSGDAAAWNGFCAEFCGESHANMRFRAFTVTPEQFEGWVALQQAPALFGAIAPAAPAPGTPAPGTPAAGTPAGQQPTAPVGHDPGVAVATAEYFVFPRDQVPAHIVPDVPIPRALSFDASLTGDPERGRELYSRTACIGCHRIRGNPTSVGITGPDLTHFGSRLTLGAGTFPNDPLPLALWIKNAPVMKPGAIMPPFGQGERDARTGVTGYLTDQQIADIAAYLQALR